MKQFKYDGATVLAPDIETAKVALEGLGYVQDHEHSNCFFNPTTVRGAVVLDAPDEYILLAEFVSQQTPTKT